MNERKIKKTDIAIIGLSGVFPKSKDIPSFWENLRAGNELVQFYSDDELRKAGIEQKILDDPNYVKAGSFIDEPGSFDYSFFGYTREEAMIMDPQIRVMHQQVWLALEDAGCNLSAYVGKIGVYLSASNNLNWRMHALTNQSNKVNPVFRDQAADCRFVHTMISYNLNLTGPSYYIETACSSSLVATHLACRNLILKECSMAIAGGIKIGSNTGIGYQYEPGMIDSKDGHCRPFDVNASGTIGGEGAGVVVLKRLADAIRDKDQVYAVIRSGAVNNDGKRKIGYTAPSIEGQAECIRQAHRLAAITADEVSYVEAHGTGTVLGDPIEVQALNRAFGENTNKQCAIGSVKSNMGHLDAAAGIAGLIKTSLALKYRQLPPSLNVSQANPKINFDEGPFYVNTQLKNWGDQEDTNLIAGVSSFGIGGTNAHLILESAPPLEPSTIASRPYKLVLTSARTKSALKRNYQNLKEYLRSNQLVDLANVAYVTQQCRQAFRYRTFSVIENHSEMADSCSLISARNHQHIIWMFPGQGSQYFQMAKGLYESEPDFRKVMDEGFSILQKLTDIDYQKIIGFRGTENDADLINETRYTQPVLFLVEYAMARLLEGWGIKPDYMIGHSLGEYVAACISGVFEYEDALKIILKRAELMYSTPKGTMLSINEPAEQILPILNKELSIAVLNTSSSCVLSGTEGAIDEMKEVLTLNQIPFMPLKTSHAFHSVLMEPILDEFEQVIASITLKEPTIPFISNLTAQPITSSEACDPKYWRKHLRNTVDFAGGIDFLLKETDGLFIEIGPGRTLSTLTKNSSHFEKTKPLINTIRHPKDRFDDNAFLTQNLGKMWAHGLMIDWDAFHGGATLQKVSLPGYAFEKTNLPARVDPLGKLSQMLQSSDTDLILEHQFDQDEQLEEDFSEDMAMERPLLSVAYIAPATDTEQRLCELWQSFLGYSQIGTQDNFFELGGDSLKAMSLLQLVQKTFKVDLSIEDFYQKNNITEIAQEIELAQKIIKMQKQSTKKNTIKI